MKFEVKGTKDGRAVKATIDAPDASQARVAAEKRMSVASVSAVATSLPAPLEQPGEAPDYEDLAETCLQLSKAGKMLGRTGPALLIIGVFCTLIGIVAIVKNQSGANMVGAGLVAFFLGLMACIIVYACHFLSGLGMAVRDMARNSFNR